MDTIPEGTVERLRDEAIAEIIRTKARDMYKREYLAMAVELRDLRKRFNAGEDLHILDQFVSAWGDETGASLRKRLTEMKDGDTLIIPGIGYRWRVVKEPWSRGHAGGYLYGGSVPPHPVGVPKP